MATYKAEFLSHYYEKKRRPLHAYAFGMIDQWAHLASFAPRTANFFSNAPGGSLILRKALNLAPERKLPRFASKTFQQWARKNRIPSTTEERPAPGGPEVILWADTFNNYYRPKVSQAASEVLTHAGFSVTVPQDHFCCGRPLYDFGMIDRAKKYLERILRILGPQIDKGTPIVVLEPSCGSVFRDELRNLFSGDERAERLRRQTFLLSEFLEHHAPGYQPPPLPWKVVLHGHCHHKAVMKMKDEESLLRKMGSALESLDAGCCGMAGPFGFEKDKFATSLAVGERALLPAIRKTDLEALIISDGFSCQEQIFQATGRRPLHLAEALQLALARPENRSRRWSKLV
jgi:Fe-S oxidoreductase